MPHPKFNDKAKTRTEKGPFSIKLVEFICQVSQYQTKLDFGLLNNLPDIQACIENTVILINQYQNLSSLEISNDNCRHCSENDLVCVWHIDVEDLHRRNTVTMSMLLNLGIRQMNRTKSCCTANLNMENFEEQNIIMILSKTMSIVINEMEPHDALQISYRSHIKVNSDGSFQSFFKFDNQIYFQKDISVLKASNGIHDGVKMVSIFATQVSHVYLPTDIKSMIYNEKVQNLSLKVGMLVLLKVELMKSLPRRFHKVVEVNTDMYYKSFSYN